MKRHSECFFSSHCSIFFALLDFLRIFRLFVAFLVYFKSFNRIWKDHVLKIIALTWSRWEMTFIYRLFTDFRAQQSDRSTKRKKRLFDSFERSKVNQYCWIRVNTRSIISITSYFRRKTRLKNMNECLIKIRICDVS